MSVMKNLFQLFGKQMPDLENEAESIYDEFERLIPEVVAESYQRRSKLIASLRAQLAEQAESLDKMYKTGDGKLIYIGMTIFYRSLIDDSIDHGIVTSILSNGLVGHEERGPLQGKGKIVSFMAYASEDAAEATQWPLNH